MKDVLIHLSSKHRRILLASVPQHSDVWNALDRAVRPRVWIAAENSTEYIVICNTAGAEVLLHLARKDCPDAVPAIDLALGEQWQAADLAKN